MTLFQFIGLGLAIKEPAVHSNLLKYKTFTGVEKQGCEPKWSEIDFRMWRNFVVKSATVQRRRRRCGAAKTSSTKRRSCRRHPWQLTTTAALTE